MPFIPAGANSPAQMKTLIEERCGLSFGSLVGFFFPDQNFDLLGQQAADRRTAPCREYFSFPEGLLADADCHVLLGHDAKRLLNAHFTCNTYHTCSQVRGLRQLHLLSNPR